MKKCSKCQFEKSESEFYLRKSAVDGLRSNCKACMNSYQDSKKEHKSDLDQKRYAENREQVLSARQRYYEQNLDKVKAYHKSILPRKTAQRRDRYATDLNYKLTCNLRSRLYGALRGGSKADATLVLLGCTIEELKSHLEAQFTDGMTWDKLMCGEIHVDHKMPCASFDLTDPTAQRKCFHYSNLQPLWAEDNFKKSYKIL